MTATATQPRVTKAQQRADARAKMLQALTNPKFIERALLALYARQTSDEQAAETTSHHNGMGFNGTDAELLSSFAKQVIRKAVAGTPWFRAEGDRLSPKQREIAQRKLAKYTGQLLEVAAERQAAKTRDAGAYQVVAVETAAEAERTMQRIEAAADDAQSRQDADRVLQEARDLALAWRAGIDGSYDGSLDYAEAHGRYA